MSADRPLKTRLLTARGRSPSSQQWLRRQLNDPYVHRARQEGWRARSVFKLQELDERFTLLRRGARVLDLGAAPGSWTQYAVKRGCRVVAIDLLPIEPIAGAELLQGDFLDPEVQRELGARLGGPADLVLSDMAASATGRRAIDRLRAEGLGETVLDFAGEVLAPGGACVLKLIKGGEAALMPRATALFAGARVVRPKATRAESSEVYLLARGLRGTALKGSDDGPFR
jgi:23S rRNA (uridine2552-2'-O)-methyltransferase